MSDSTRDLLIRGIAAAKANSKDEARFYLEWVTREPDAERDQMIEAWRYLAAISDDPKQKRDCLEQALAANPSDPEARRALAILNGELNPADVVDPDRPLPYTPPLIGEGPGERSVEREPATPIEARRFVCSNCGGRMTFTPDGTALTCAYCGRHQSLIAALDAGAMVAEQNFTVALATAKGHSRPVTTQALKCASCGASVMLSPQTLSQNCPFCATPYVIEQAESRELIMPDGLVPFAVSREDANRAVMEWYRKEGFKTISADAFSAGVYLPTWTFDLGGTIEWNCLVEHNEVWLPQSGSQLVYEDDLLVCASHSLRAELLQETSAFRLDRIVPYDARYLADWHAETYQIAVDEASLVARSRALEKSRAKIHAAITQNYRDLSLSTLRLVVESYKLILLPMWLARYRLEKKWYNVVVNGQTGAVRGEKPATGVSKWIANLLGG